MNKKEFLKELSTKLKENNYNDRDNLINYYDELISDAKESGKNEKKVISELGSIDEILNDIDIIDKIEIAKKKTTLSNSTKAIIAVLSIFSLPLLIPLIITGIIFLIAAATFILSIIITIGALFFSATLIPFVFIWQVATGTLPWPSFIFAFGISLILIGLFYELIKVTLKGCKYLAKSFFKCLTTVVKKKRGVKRDE